MFILGAYVCESIVFVFSKKFKQKVSGAQYLAIAQITTALITWILQFSVYRQNNEINKLTMTGMSSLLFVSIVSCVLCFAIHYWLLNHVDGHRLALFDGIHTISAIAVSFLFFQEEIRPIMFLGGGLVIIAIIIYSIPKKIKIEKSC